MKKISNLKENKGMIEEKLIYELNHNENIDDKHFQVWYEPIWESELHTNIDDFMEMIYINNFIFINNDLLNWVLCIKSNKSTKKK